jgi:hypothetical protein
MYGQDNFIIIGQKKGEERRGESWQNRQQLFTKTERRREERSRSSRVERRREKRGVGVVE